MRSRTVSQGLEQFDRIVETGPVWHFAGIENGPMRATFSEVYTEIRNVFAGTEDAKKAGFSAKHFSFNTPGGRCENCEGMGYVENNMLFFANTEVVCPVCNGNRFDKGVLAVTYRGYSIKEILDMSVDEARPCLCRPCTLKDGLALLQPPVGLGYLQLGQALTTGPAAKGERWLAKELIGKPCGKNRCSVPTG
ncbi:MAG: hypothetical protein ACLUL2_05310 [Blautia sp.]